VAEDGREPDPRQEFAAVDVEVRPADAGGLALDEHFARPDAGFGRLADANVPLSMEDGGLHAITSPKRRFACSQS
jgi:hypothetical protein